MKFNQRDERSKLGKIAKILGIKDINKEIIEWYKNGMSSSEISEKINSACKPYYKITAKRIGDIIKYNGFVRSKSEARMAAIKSGRIIYKKKSVKDVFKIKYIDLGLRYKILAKSGFKCCACGGTEFLEVDYIIPIKNGGTNDESNLQALCWRCKSGKDEIE